MIRRLEAVHHVLALRLCLVLVIGHAKRGRTGVSRTTQGHCHSCLQVHFRLAVVVELVVDVARVIFLLVVSVVMFVGLVVCWLRCSRYSACFCCCCC